MSIGFKHRDYFWKYVRYFLFAGYISYLISSFVCFFFYLNYFYVYWLNQLFETLIVFTLLSALIPIIGLVSALLGHSIGMVLSLCVLFSWTFAVSLFFDSIEKEGKGEIEIYLFELLTWKIAAVGAVVFCFWTSGYIGASFVDVIQNELQIDSMIKQDLASTFILWPFPVVALIIEGFLGLLTNEYTTLIVPIFYVLPILIVGIPFGVLLLVWKRDIDKKLGKKRIILTNILKEYFVSTTDLKPVNYETMFDQMKPGILNLVKREKQFIEQELDIESRHLGYIDQSVRKMIRRLEVTEELQRNGLLEFIRKNFTHATKKREVWQNYSIRHSTLKKLFSLRDSLKEGMRAEEDGYEELQHKEVGKWAGIVCHDYLRVKASSRGENPQLNNVDFESRALKLAKQIENYYHHKTSFPRYNEKEVAKWTDLKKKIADLQVQLDFINDHIAKFEDLDNENLSQYQSECEKLKEEVKDIITSNEQWEFIEINEMKQLRSLEELINEEIKDIHNIKNKKRQKNTRN